MLIKGCETRKRDSHPFFLCLNLLKIAFYMRNSMIKQTIPLQQRILHIRIAGQSQDLALRDLDLNQYSHDKHIRQALARYLEVSLKMLNGYVIERHANGNMTVRPEAIFG